MAKRRLKTIAGREVYYRPPVLAHTTDDYYQLRTRKALTDHGRHQLEVLVKDWISQEVDVLKDDKQRWRAKLLEHDGRRIIPGDHVQQWPWTRKIRTTSTRFVPICYEANQKLVAGRPESPHVLSGLCMRVTEDKELLWKPAQVETPPWFVPETDATDVYLTWKRRQIQPLKRKFERALVEHLPDQTLASLYKACL